MRSHRALWLALASIAFGVIEGAVVVYLREIAYPTGFHFPLAPMRAGLLRMELVRELATLLLLFGLAGVAARDGLRRFAAFVYCFGIWDIVYYLTLKVALGWPASIMDGDVLFLIPVPWIAPVLAPVLVAIALIGAGLYVLLLPEDHPFALRGRDWLVEVLAGTILLASFLWNSGPVMRGEQPGAYPWWLFGLGLVLGLAWLARRILRAREGRTQ